MAGTLHIQLLGDFRLAHDDVLLTDPDAPKTQSLLAYLLLHRHAPQARSHLSYLFWPDSTEAQARSNLRKQIHHLRQALPGADRFLHADRQTVHWRPDGPFVLDLDTFAAALAQATAAEHGGDLPARQAALERAVAAYQGDLLPSCYDDWVFEQRERLREEYTTVLGQLVDLLVHQGDHSAAIRHAQRLLRHDPLRESTYRQLMRLYAAAGNRALALRTYHACATLLQQELEVEPGAATRAVYEELLQGAARAEPGPVDVPASFEAAPAARSPTSVPLVGREEAWAQLQVAWQDAAGGAPHLALITGEAGIGKTRLAEEFLAAHQRQGVTTDIARCYPSGGSLPYGPVASWLRGEALHEAIPPLDDLWLTEIARLLPEILVDRPDLPRPEPLTQEWQRRRFFQAIARPLTGRRRLALLLDDVQWCDSDTLAWLGYLLHERAAAPGQFLVVATIRSDHLPDAGDLARLVADLVRSGQATQIDLYPLARDEVAELASRLTRRDVAADEAGALYRETEGNPLFVTEMVRAGLASGTARDWTREVVALPTAIQQAITSRLMQLSPPARDLAHVAAAIGRQFTHPILAHACHCDQDTLVAALDELWQRRIIREQGTDAYDFSHDKIREVVYAGLPPPRRRLLHGRVALALEEVHAHELDAVAAAAALHFEQAGHAPRAVPYYRRAAGAASAVYANEEAIRHLRRALELAPQAHVPDVELAALHESLGTLLDRAGQHAEARAHYHDALPLVPASLRVRRAHLHASLAETWTAHHLHADAHAAFDAALAELGSEPPEPDEEWWPTWTRIQFARADSLYFQARLEELTDLNRQLEVALARHGTIEQQAQLYARVRQQRLRQERYRPSLETIEMTHRSIELARQAGNRELAGYEVFAYGFLLLWSGDLDGADEWLSRALHEAQSMGHVPLEDRCRAYLTISARLRGDAATARNRAEAAVRVATAEQSPIYLGVAHANLAWLCAREGHLSAVHSESVAAFDYWRPIPFPLEWLARFPLLAAHLSTPDLEQAVAQARAMLDPVQQSLPHHLDTHLSDAIQSWDRSDPSSARRHLEAASAAAHELNYV